MKTTRGDVLNDIAILFKDAMLDNEYYPYGTVIEEELINGDRRCYVQVDTTTGTFVITAGDGEHSGIRLNDGSWNSFMSFIYDTLQI